MIGGDASQSSATVILKDNADWSVSLFGSHLCLVLKSASENGKSKVREFCVSLRGKSSLGHFEHFNSFNPLNVTRTTSTHNNDKAEKRFEVMLRYSLF